MSDVEKQESQKTVVAFITGLLIGGLLVWVFSSTPEGAKQTEEVSLDTQEVSTETSTEVVADTETESEMTVGEGALSVADQAAGTVVTLGATELPTQSGWIVVRDYMDGTPGNVLGAARFNADEGLTPTTVELMRATTAGSSYLVMFYTNAGDIGFKTAEDKPIEGVSATFKAL